MIKREAEIFGLLFLWDGFTNIRATLLSILASMGNTPVDILEIVYWQGNLADDGKKNGT